MNKLFRLFARLFADHRGAIAVEFALMLPVLTALTLSGVEIYRFILLNQKIERVSVTFADLASQAETLSDGDLNSLFSVTSQVMVPFDLTDSGQVIVSSVGAKNGDAPKINWQRSFGLASNSSSIGSEGGVPAFPSGFTVRDNENVIVAEVFYDYSPLIVTGVIDPVTLYNATFFRPRFGALDTLN